MPERPVRDVVEYGASPGPSSVVDSQLLAYHDILPAGIQHGTIGAHPWV